MRTRAVAVGSDRSNAIGPVELECLASGLVIVHHGVGAFQDGYAPGALTAGTRVTVPWHLVREARLEGDRLFLSLDESVTPHHRLLLTAFSTGDPPDLSELRRRRFVVRIGTAAATLVVGLLVAVTALRVSTETGAGAAVLLGCLSAGVVFLAGMVADHRIGLFTTGPDAEAARLALVADLARHLPGLAIEPRPPPPSRPEPARNVPSFQSLLPRSTAAVVITMSAALLAAVITASSLSRSPERDGSRRVALEEERPTPATPPPRAAEPAGPLLASIAPTPKAPGRSAAPPPATGSVAVLAGACTCRRADSLLWRDGLPRVSLVLIDKRVREHNGHPHLELELGVVNNWEQPIPEVSLLVQFFDRDPPPSQKRTPTYDRPLFFEGPLEPGQAIKWHVEARGTEFEVVAPHEDLLDPGGADAAATNLLADLLKANHRPIRLHGAMMLAYLGDPRAKEGALGLREALREDEAPYIDRLMWALSDVKTCSLEVSEGAAARVAKACVYNASTEPRRDLALRLRALDRAFRHDTPVEPPPLVVAERTWKLSGELAPKQGAVVSVAFDTSNADGIAPKAFEAYADREEFVF
jgi:hypothetical protein